MNSYHLPGAYPVKMINAITVRCRIYFSLCVLAEAASLQWVSMSKEDFLIRMTARVLFQSSPFLQKCRMGNFSYKTTYPADFQRVYHP